MFDCGLTDFAGSGVVHVTGGVAALVGATVVGPRTGRFGEDGSVRAMPQQSVIFQTLGTLILWMGWYGFNGVSTLYIQNYSGVAAHTMVTTTIAAATGCLVCTLIGYGVNHTIDPADANNGILAGLVSITAPCSTCSNAGAFIIGTIGRRGDLLLLGQAADQDIKMEIEMEEEGMGMGSSKCEIPK